MKSCSTCRHRPRPMSACISDGCPGDGGYPAYAPQFPTLDETGRKIAAIRAAAKEEKPMNENAALAGQAPVSLPNDAQGRLEYPMADGLLDYFPNALAQVARLSWLATQQHHPDQPMHWDRSKSTDHRNKIIRHLVDTHTVDDKGIDHWAMVCWRSLAGYQEYLERKHGLPPSRASRNALPSPEATQH